MKGIILIIFTPLLFINNAMACANHRFLPPGAHEMEMEMFFNLDDLQLTDLQLVDIKEIQAAEIQNRDKQKDTLEVTEKGN